MQNVQTSEFLHLLGHFRVPLVTGMSSKGDGTTRQFRGYFYGRVFSLGLGGGCGVSFFSFPSSFSISSTCQVGHFESHISNFSSNFCKFRSPTAGRYTSCIKIRHSKAYVLIFDQNNHCEILKGNVFLSLLFVANFCH